MSSSVADVDLLRTLIFFEEAVGTVALEEEVVDMFKGPERQKKSLT